MSPKPGTMSTPATAVWPWAGTCRDAPIFVPPPPARWNLNSSGVGEEDGLAGPSSRAARSLGGPPPDLVSTTTPPSGPAAAPAAGTSQRGREPRDGRGAAGRDGAGRPPEAAAGTRSPVHAG